MKTYLLIGFLFAINICKAQNTNVYFADASKGNPAIISGHLKFGTNYNHNGDTLSANSLYFIKNNKPWFPVMGEFHFSRFPKEQWEESILKMKAAGITVIATYVFWIHHEETEGNWTWKNNNDLHYFASLCKKHNVFLFLRIGPWCHSEVRNGGFPDWLLAKTKTRRNDSAYLHYVSLLYKQVHEQVKDFYFKNNGTIIGTQIENEFRFNNSSGLSHMLTLKKLAVDAGIDVPYYTATGWPGSDLKQKELIPVWGAYPEAPWDKRTTELPLSDNYRFDSLRNDFTIGNDLVTYSKNDTANFKGYLYPYATAEMGGGNQITYHRRPVISSDDVTALAYVKTGAGANLMGYYMFHGGINPLGKFSTMQESKATKYPNDYTIMNYDFQSPLGQWGQVQSSYRSFKRFHLFLDDFGNELAATASFFPSVKPTGNADSTTLRWAVRSNGNSCFVFISNYQRSLTMQSFSNVQFTVKLKNETVKFPAEPITIPKGLQAVFPFNLQLDQVQLNYATVQPLCILHNSITTFVFFAHNGVKPEYVFDATNIAGITSSAKAIVTKKENKFIVTVQQPGIDCMIEIKKKDGTKIQLMTISEEDALNAWKSSISKKEYLFITSSECSFDCNSVLLRNLSSNEFSVQVYPATAGLSFSADIKVKYSTKNNIASYKLSVPKIKWTAVLKKLNGNNLQPAVLPDTIKSMPVYEVTPKNIPGAGYWTVTIPSSLPAHVKDAMLQIEYTGDTQAAYLDSTIVADDFYFGLPFTIGLRHMIAKSKTHQLLLLLTPYTGQMPVYWQTETRNKVKINAAPTIESVKIQPYYEIKAEIKQ